jgi:hypothetical protein
MYNNDFEAEFCQKAWQIISDISEQLSHNQKFAVSLLGQAGKLKVRVHVPAPACT